MDGFVSAYSKKTGKKQRVPRHFIGHPVLGRNLELTPSAVAAEIAATEEAGAGTPSEAWKRTDLDKFAQDLGIDTADLPTKADVVAAIEAAAQATQDSDGTPPTDETPATGDKEE